MKTNILEEIKKALYYDVYYETLDEDKSAKKILSIIQKRLLKALPKKSNRVFGHIGNDTQKIYEVGKTHGFDNCLFKVENIIKSELSTKE